MAYSKKPGDDNRQIAKAVTNLRRKVVEALREFENELPGNVSVHVKPGKFLDRLAAIAASSADIADEKDGEE